MEIVHLYTLRRAKRTGSVPRGNVPVYSYSQPKRHTDSGKLPCDSVCQVFRLLVLVSLDCDHSLSVGNGLNRENNNNNIAHGAMIPGRAGQRLDPCGRRTTLDPLIERYSAFHH